VLGVGFDEARRRDIANARHDCAEMVSAVRLDGRRARSLACELPGGPQASSPVVDLFFQGLQAHLLFEFLCAVAWLPALDRAHCKSPAAL
jgi:hypothetical protein